MAAIDSVTMDSMVRGNGCGRQVVFPSPDGSTFNAPGPKPSTMAANISLTESGTLKDASRFLLNNNATRRSERFSLLHQLSAWSTPSVSCCSASFGSCLSRCAPSSWAPWPSSTLSSSFMSSMPEPDSHPTSALCMLRAQGAARLRSMAIFFVRSFCAFFDGRTAISASGPLTSEFLAAMYVCFSFCTIGASNFAFLASCSACISFMALLNLWVMSLAAPRCFSGMEAADA
mmetsp:Transcript_102218/g.202932  ORF Transcript_102218/g.202932 Transcript_102218/m.202932 type:complete len:231 (+) Transcript_102218:867-1559(+)